MPRPRRPNLRRIHLTLDKTQLARLEFYFGTTIGVSESIRIAIADLLVKHETLAKNLIEGKPLGE